MESDKDISGRLEECNLRPVSPTTAVKSSINVIYIDGLPSEARNRDKKASQNTYEGYTKVGEQFKQTCSVAPTAPKSKRFKQNIGSDTLVVMMESNNQHFPEYCKGRKRVVQKVPGAVWKLVYQDFLEDQKAKFDSAGERLGKCTRIKERTLQGGLRSSLNEISTGVYDDKSRKATNQDGDLMLLLKDR